MGDQSEVPKNDEQTGTFSMSDLNQALPTMGNYNSPQQNYPAPSLLQYQLSPPAYPPGQYQQTYMVAQSQYNSGQTEPPQYYSYSVGPQQQQQVDASHGGYHYGGQVGYRNSPTASPVSGPQFATPMPRTAQPGQAQQYQMPRFQYQLPPQAYQLPLGRATSFPAYTSQTRSPAQSVPQTSAYPVFSPPFLQNVPPSFSDEPAAISSDPENFLPRGPPRKPKQSGFALWVGNLPRDVRLEELKDFFAIEGLESIFLIRKSNCAFVNYKKEEDCAKALATFNDKMFKNVRLVCRLRKSSPSRTPTNPSIGGSGDSSGSTHPIDAESITKIPLLSSTTMGASDPAEDESTQNFSSPTSSTPSKDRYFIMKSLTKEDLAWSVANKIWATQPHNEKVLNEAFKNSENVYLIFSVNKSGEFFGYARMASEILATPGAEEAKAAETGSKVAISDPPVLLAGPKTTITPRTHSAPRGKIFEDEVRGTVFWEVAESSDNDEEDEAERDQPQGKEGAKWGNPFKIEWIKWDASVQFQRTRTLRNPWNGNREVKISRDGTEIEPTIGSRLLKEFDADPSQLGPGLGSTNVNRRMSYPTAGFRSMSATPIVYQRQPTQMSPGMTYVPYSTQSMSYNYSPARSLPQQPQNFGTPGQYSYGQQPRQQ